MIVWPCMSIYGLWLTKALCASYVASILDDVTGGAVRSKQVHWLADTTLS